MRILVDMDDTLLETRRAFEKLWRQEHPGKMCVAADDMEHYFAADCYPEEYHEFITDLLKHPELFRIIEPAEGGLNAINEMKAMGHEVFLCTAPMITYENCVREKYEWVEKSLGKEWLPMLILTMDKTIVKADILIDDKPEVTGAEKPSWEHVLYDRLYNRNVANKKRLTWKNWKEVLNL